MLLQSKILNLCKYVLLKMSTWYSKHVEESNNIWRINNIQCITLVVLYDHRTKFIRHLASAILHPCLCISVFSWVIQTVRAGSGAHPGSYSKGTRVFSGGQMAGARSWPPTFIKCRGLRGVEPYMCPLKMSLWRRHVLTRFFLPPAIGGLAFKREDKIHARKNNRWKV